jgi:hypothetical protein
MRRNRLLHPPAVERERFDRLRLLMDWFNHDFIDSQQCFFELVAVLGRFRHMKTRALADDDVGVVQRIGPSCDWITFRHSVRRAVWNQLKGSSGLPGLLAGFTAPRAPHYLKTQLSKDGNFFEYQVGIFPFDLRFNNRIDASNLQDWLKRYLLDMFFGDLVGMSTAAIGLCLECNSLFINRRAIPRQFCSARCRWKNAAREKQKAEEAAKAEAERVARAARRGRHGPIFAKARRRIRRLQRPATSGAGFSEIIKQLSERLGGDSGPWAPEAQNELPAPKEEDDGKRQTTG